MTKCDEPVKETHGKQPGAVTFRGWPVTFRGWPGSPQPPGRRLCPAQAQRHQRGQHGPGKAPGNIHGAQRGPGGGIRGSEGEIREAREDMGPATLREEGLMLQRRRLARERVEACVGGSPTPATAPSPP